MDQNGQLESTFGNNGIVHFNDTNASQNDWITCITLDPIGNIFLGGYTHGSLGEQNAGGPLTSDIFVIKLTPAGDLASEFNQDGILQFGHLTVGSTHASSNEILTDIVVDGLGRVIISGYTSGNLGDLAGQMDVFLARITEGGDLDPSFDDDGIVHFGDTTMGSRASQVEGRSRLALGTSGEIFVLSNSYGDFGEVNAGQSDVILMKLQSNGSLDPTYAGTGVFQLGLSSIGSNGSGDDFASVIKLHNDGSIYFAGHTNGSLGETSAGAFDGYVAKLTVNGNLDSNFHTMGIRQLGVATIGLGASANDWATSVQVDSSGDIYIAGATEGSVGEAGGGNADILLVKL